MTPEPPPIAAPDSSVPQPPVAKAFDLKTYLLLLIYSVTATVFLTAGLSTTVVAVRVLRQSHTIYTGIFLIGFLILGMLIVGLIFLRQSLRLFTHLK